MHRCGLLADEDQGSIRSGGMRSNPVQEVRERCEYGGWPWSHIAAAVSVLKPGGKRGHDSPGYRSSLRATLPSKGPTMDAAGSSAFPGSLT